MNRMLKLPEVINRTGLSRSSIYAYIKQGDFPENIKLGTRSVAWPETVINEWIDAKVSGGAQ